MTAVGHDLTLDTPRASSTSVLAALALTESRRMLTHPILVLGLLVSVWWLLSTDPGTETWSGQTYGTLAVSSVPLLVAITVVVALAFHRERTEVAAEAPVRETRRALARLLAAVPLVGLAGAYAALLAWRERDLGGLRLGTGRFGTLEALHTTAELAQHVALAVLAVAVGAALGRRVPRLVVSVPLLVAGWYAAALTWLFSHPVVVPFSVILNQPLHLPTSTRTADVLAHPSDWLFVAPDDYTPYWARLFISEPLSWWHNGWLVGLALLLLAVALPGRPARRWLLVVGLVLAVLGVVGQVAVVP